MSQIEGDAVQEIGKSALLGEANLIRQLFRAYLNDRQFLKQDKRNRIVLFLDSNEIKAYVRPDAAGSLDGFLLRLETLADCWSAKSSINPKRRGEIALRHDQILNGLLFDPHQACGILSPHTEEMEREVRFVETTHLDRVFKLVQDARTEISNKTREDGRRYAAAAKANPERGKDLVQFVRKHAPALATVLGEKLNSPLRRMQAVLSDSELTLFDEMPWEEFGVDLKVEEELKALEPSAETIREQRQKLRRFDFRKNSLGANYIDSSALAQLSLLRTHLLSHDIRHLRVLLVTRAQTLLRAAIDSARDTAAIEDSTWQEVLAVRHPRMLALSLAQAAVLDDATDLALGTAIDLWRSQLSALPDLPLEPSLLTNHLEAFINAWDSFESSRLAMETSWRGRKKIGDEKASEDSRFAKELIDIFSSVNPEKTLRDGILEDFLDYGAAANAFLLSGEALQLKARVHREQGSDKVYITPLAEAPAGPIRLAANPALSEATEDLFLEKIAEVAAKSEKPLVWALSSACAAEWQRAAILADSALKLSGFERDPVRTDVADEARLLRAEIRRLGGDAPPSGEPPSSDAAAQATAALKRFEQNLKELAEISDHNAVRRTREEAAQVVEAGLRKAPLPDLGDRLVDLFARLGAAADAASSASEKARCIALQLILYLFDRRYLLPAGTPALRRHEQRVKDLHKQLGKIMNQLQDLGDLDVMPRRAKAVEFIGFALFDRDLPKEYRADLTDLQRGLGSSTDALGRVLKDELERIREREFRTFHPELSLHPIAFADAAEQLGQCDPAAQAAALRVDEIGWRFFNTGPDIKGDQELGASIKTLTSALQQPATFGTFAHFFLRAYLHYAQLLKATMEPRHVRRTRYAELRDAYQDFSAQYPEEVLPLIRLSYVAERLEDFVCVERALTRALELVRSSAVGLPHVPAWTQSLVRRRYGMMVVLRRREEAGWLWDKSRSAKDAFADAAVLAELCGHLFDAEREDSADSIELVESRGPAKDAHRKERERRWNNIVFFGSRLIERLGEEAAVMSVPGLKRIGDYVKDLAPSIEAQESLSVLHTIGCYCAAVGQTESLQAVAKRMMNIAATAERLSAGLDSNENLEEFWGWFKANLATVR